jgi:hypothetical protein
MAVVDRIIILEFGNIHCPIKVILLKIIVGFDTRNYEWYNEKIKNNSNCLDLNNRNQ